MAFASDRFPFYCRDPRRIEQSVAALIAHHQLLRGVARVGLAVSGGADSVALFYLLLPLCRERGIDAMVLHLNHGLRAEAEGDAHFVQELAAHAGLPFLCQCAKLAERPSDGLSLEMAARAARLEFFRQCSQTASLDAIMTGHNADDVAETLLLRLARGAGATGLAGLRPRSALGGCVLLRPLLSVSGGALRSWLSERGHTWCEDASNRDASIPRNFVRHTLLPQLETTWRSDIRARLCQSAETLREDDALLDTLAERELAALEAQQTSGGLPVDALLQQPLALQRRIVRQWLFRHARHSSAAGLAHVQAILKRCGEPGDWRLSLPGAVSVLCRDKELVLSHGANAGEDARAPDSITLPVPTSPLVRWGDVEITVALAHGVSMAPGKIGCYPATCTLSAEAIAGRPLIVRSRQPGDRIAPTGMTGTKKVQDIFVDAKIPEALRDSIPLVVCDGEVAWVPGYRVARRFAVPAADAPCVRISLKR